MKTGRTSHKLRTISDSQSTNNFITLKNYLKIAVKGRKKTSGWAKMS